MIFKERFDKLISDLEKKIRTNHPTFEFVITDENSYDGTEIIEFMHSGRTFLALFLFNDKTRVCSEVIMQPIAKNKHISLAFELGLEGNIILGNQLGVLLFDNNFEYDIEKVEFRPEKKILCKNINHAVDTIYAKIREQLP